MSIKSYTPNKNISRKVKILQELGADQILDNSLNKIIEYYVIIFYKPF
jgi:hypothetical protein